MRIDDAFTKGPGAVGPKTGAEAVDKVNGESASVVKAAKPKPADRAATVDVSDQARALAAKSAEPVDQAKVARLRAALADGTFKVDAGAIAKKLLGDEG